MTCAFGASCSDKFLTNGGELVAHLKAMLRSLSLFASLLPLVMLLDVLMVSWGLGLAPRMLLIRLSRLASDRVVRSRSIVVGIGLSIRLPRARIVMRLFRARVLPVILVRVLRAIVILVIAANVFGIRSTMLTCRLSRRAVVSRWLRVWA